MLRRGPCIVPDGSTSLTPSMNQSPQGASWPICSGRRRPSQPRDDLAISRSCSPDPLPNPARPPRAQGPWRLDDVGLATRPTFGPTGFDTAQALLDVHLCPPHPNPVLRPCPGWCHGPFRGPPLAAPKPKSRWLLAGDLRRQPCRLSLAVPTTCADPAAPLPRPLNLAARCLDCAPSELFPTTCEVAPWPCRNPLPRGPRNLPLVQ